MNQYCEKRPILIIDGFNYFIRHFMVNESMTNTSELCGGVVGFLKGLYGLTSKFSPSKIFVVWEQGGGSPRRKKIFPAYKENRIKVKSEFKAIGLPENALPSKQWIKEDKENKLKQIKTLVDCLKHTPVCQIYVADTEADDIISYIVRHYLKEEECLKIIVSSDRDFYQLLDIPNVKIFNPADKSFHDGPIVRVKTGKDTYADVPANNYALLRSLTGDDSDNIPGVPGMGFKTALKLFPGISVPGTDETINYIIETARSHLNEKKPLKVYKAVVECEEVIKRNWDLMYLHSSSLAPTQISKINYSIEQFVPKMNKLQLIKTMLNAGIVSDLNYDNFCYQMQICLVNQ